MSVNSYLVNLASELVLSGDDLSGITRSISTLQTHIDSHFSKTVSLHFKFGSSTRGTMLPRKADSNSDIDYMIVFDNDDITLKPQTYLDRIRRFVEYYYTSSEIKQSSPVIVLELNHIKFDLVPAIGSFQIPSPGTYYNDWIDTFPNTFNTTLTNANTLNNNQIKPLARLVKYWNASRGHVFSSFSLEEHIVGLDYYGCSSLSSYFYSYWPYLDFSGTPSQSNREKLTKAQETVARIKNLEIIGQGQDAEYELTKFLPKP